MNLIEKLGLENCKAIVDGAPGTTTIFSLANGHYYRPNINPFYPPEKPVWTRIWIDADGHTNSETRFLNPYMPIEIKYLRTAIAKFECDHDWEDITCNGDLERQLICTYCSMQKSVPFELNAKRWTDEDTDHCIDIRNHISPLTGVIER